MAMVDGLSCERDRERESERAKMRVRGSAGISAHSTTLRFSVSSVVLYLH